MKKIPSALGFLVIVFLVAATAACLSLAVYSKLRAPSDRNAHEWIHTQLSLTAEQDKALVPIERRYREKRRGLEQELHLANMELAEAILADGQGSERVTRAFEKISGTMGDLQETTIAHVFEMKAVLTPEQYQKLLNLTANALYHLDAEHGNP